MESTKNTIFTYERLYKAYLDCRENKRKTRSALEFEFNLESNLHKLLSELRGKTYRPGASTCFVVKRPKVREIFAANFRDRIVHHLFVAELNRIIEPKLSYDSYACRKGRGTHAAINRLKSQVKKLTKNNLLKDIYVLQLDIASFFMSIDQDILYRIVAENIDKNGHGDEIWKSEMRWLGRIVIYNKVVDDYRAKGELCLYYKLPKSKSLFNANAGKGLPIGNYTSQFFANLYLNELDQYIKRSLRAKYYVRYVDDFVILSENLALLQGLPRKVDSFLSNRLGLTLNHQKTKLKNIRSGIDFLGYIVKCDHILVRNNVVGRFEEKLNAVQRSRVGFNGGSGRFIQIGFNRESGKLRQTAASYFGHFGHANSYFLEKSTRRLWTELWKLMIGRPGLDANQLIISSNGGGYLGF
jgi:retron-type reverse transcriptase